MSSSHSEKFILGIAFQHPELIPVIQANAPGLFSEGPARVTWNQIDELFGPGDPVNIAIVGDALWGKVPMDWLHSCLDGVAGMGLNHAETELKKTIAAIKKDRMIRRLQEKVGLWFGV